ncbi:MAG: hypothetical protein ABFD07_09035, partial [Methanobacterium sp.]
GDVAIRSVFSHLLENIILLLPSSEYRISFEKGTPELTWVDIDFKIHEKANKKEFLDLLIEKYGRAYINDPEICLGISGGYDSRLELAILHHLKKIIHCYHFVLSPREKRLVGEIADTVNTTLREIPSKQLFMPGWVFLKEKGYITQWQGFFGPSTPFSAGLYLEIKKEYPNCAIRILSNIYGWKGRRYRHAEQVLEFWLDEEEKSFKKSLQRYSDDTDILINEQKRRKEQIKKIIPYIQKKCERKDIVMDLSYGLFAPSGNIATRAVFLVENGMPVFDGMKETMEYFISLPKEDKMQQNFTEWAIKELNPPLFNKNQISSSMNLSERQFGWIGRIPGVGNLLEMFITQNDGYVQEWYKEKEVIEIFNLLPEFKSIATHANDDKSKLFIAQICRFLMRLHEKKNVSFCLIG